MNRNANTGNKSLINLHTKPITARAYCAYIKHKTKYLHCIPTCFSALICNLATVYILHKQMIKGTFSHSAHEPLGKIPPFSLSILSVAYQEHSYYPQI